jgi:hypothetical protein
MKPSVLEEAISSLATDERLLVERLVMRLAACDQSADVEVLSELVRRRMLKYPYGQPHPETIEMIVEGVLAVIDLSNARKREYASEPWRDQSSLTHASHGVAHFTNAARALRFPKLFSWTSDLKQPEVVHAIMRGLMCLHQHRKGR